MALPKLKSIFNSVQLADIKTLINNKFATFNPLSNPMTGLGDMIYGLAGGTPARIAPNTTITQKFLAQTGDGVDGAAPSWQEVTLTTYVPYTGATQDVNIGLFGLLSQNITLNSATANQILATNGTKQLVSLDTATYPSLTELSYVKGVTSAIQTQLNGKQNTLTNPVTGTGTINYLSKFTGTSTIGNSIIRESSRTIAIGQTPFSWIGGYDVLQVGDQTSILSSGGASEIYTNAYFDSVGSNIKYSFNGLATIYALSNGAFRWFTAPAGLAGNVATFTQAMTLDASGNLVLGTTSASARLHIRGSGTTSATSNFLLENSAGTRTLTSYDSGTIVLGSATVPTRTAKLYVFQGSSASNSGIILNYGALDEFQTVGIWADAGSYGAVNIGNIESTAIAYTTIDARFGVRSPSFSVTTRWSGLNQPSYIAAVDSGVNNIFSGYSSTNIGRVTITTPFNPSINYLNSFSYISRNTVNLMDNGVVAGTRSYHSIALIDNINETVASSNTLTTGILHLPNLTSAYNYRAFEFGILDAGIGGSTSYTPNAAITDYRWGIINPVINASVNSQIINALDISLAGSDGVFTGVTRNALRLSGGNLALTDVNMLLGTTTGTKIGTATSQKLGFWNATPIIQPTTAVAAATFVANTSLIANDTATFDGYTIGQVVKALRNTGILA